jgi:hypothetical protein
MKRPKLFLSVMPPHPPRQICSFFGGSWFELVAGMGEQKLFCEQSDAQRREQKFSVPPCLPQKNKKNSQKKAPPGINQAGPLSEPTTGSGQSIA